MKIIVMALLIGAHGGYLFGMEKDKVDLNSKLYDAVKNSSAKDQLIQVQKLLEEGADANTAQKYTVLMLAINQKNIELFKLLVQFKADVNKVGGPFESTPLMWAVTSESEELCELLLQHGAKLSSKNSFNETALKRARDRQNEKIINLLIKHGARN